MVLVIGNGIIIVAALLDQLRESASGDKPLSEDLSKMLDEAQRMVKEMEKRNLAPQKTAAEKERTEARKRMILTLSDSVDFSAFCWRCWTKEVSVDFWV